ncbi:telomerase-binding protein EST1A [Zerene cesonia]|uniref:telomerase-binding protein EST1A n=1 Tax=Zerene cesonia TaxID=33412 RepID=UPI0018E52CB4|nr:telomerase-binding protein EST1A [Zerene cesonia]
MRVNVHRSIVCVRARRMETFEESATQMLGQFRALLHRQPLPTPAARLLQLTALNMFAVETNAAYLKGSETGERTAWLDCALAVSLLMFGALLERCCALLPEPPHSQQHTDALSLLPAIKVWSDWMLCHSSVWNPPPCLDNFGTENENDPWSWLAKLMNILESMDDKSIELESEAKDGHVCVRLAEDASLAGFTPLMYMEPAAAWARAEPPLPHHAAEHALRTRKLLFFGTEYLVGVEPPVLKLEYPTDAQPRYVSAVQQTQINYTQLQHLTEDSEDEDSTSGATSGPASHSEGVDVEGADEVTRRLLRRKEQLETRKATLEKRRQRMQEMLGSGSVCVELEVRPRWLVPDTNCFIDHLPLLRALVAPAHTYQIAVPLVVMTELEGLCRCSRLGEAARNALAWVSGSGSGGGSGGGGGSGTGSMERSRGVRLVTTRGSVLTSRTFTAEDHRPGHSNDDRVLDTAINLQANISNEQDTKEEKAGGAGGAGGAARARRVCEVVLLTDDRNLRVKALAAELPARDLPSFVQWAGVTSDAHAKPESSSVGNSSGDSK